jgi:type II secretory pathway pseudopilin PulG
VVELLVVISIIAVLAAILLPAVNSARMAALRNQNLNNVKQITTAIISYEEAKKTLPPLTYRYDKTAPKGDYTSSVSWAFVILPHLEEQNLYDRLVVTKKNYEPENQMAMGSKLSIYANPIRRDASNLAPFFSQSNVTGASLDYAANGGIVGKVDRDKKAMPLDGALSPGGQSGIINKDYPYGQKFDPHHSGPFHRDVALPLAAVKDGLSSTLCIGDRWMPSLMAPNDPQLKWSDLAGMPGDSWPTLIRYANPDAQSVARLPFPTSTTDPSILKFGGARIGDACFGMLDGRAVWLQYSIDPIVFQHLASIHDGQHVPPLD